MHLVAAAVVSVGVAGTALAQKKVPGQHFTPLTPVTWTCPPMVLPPITAVATDWMLNSPQGWLERGAIEPGTSGSMFRCYYGVDKSNPAGQRAFNIHKSIPANYIGCQLSGSGNTSLNCSAKP